MPTGENLNRHRLRTGRPKGAKNKVTRAVKEAVHAALNAVDGAEAFFLSLKNSTSREDRRTFAHICARLIPTELTGDATLAPLIQIVRFESEELAKPYVMPPLAAAPLQLESSNDADGDSSSS